MEGPCNVIARIIAEQEGFERSFDTGPILACETIELAMQFYVDESNDLKSSILPRFRLQDTRDP